MYHLVTTVFGFILNIFNIKRVMGFTASNTIIKNNIPAAESSLPLHLNEAEIVTLLLLIKRSTFTGEDLEPLYNLVLKLQQQYLNINK
jgi:hypothetical protein